MKELRLILSENEQVLFDYFNDIDLFEEQRYINYKINVDFLMNETLLHESIFKAELICVGEFENNNLKDIAIFKFPSNKRTNRSITLYFISNLNAEFIKKVISYTKKYVEKDYNKIKIYIRDCFNKDKIINIFTKIGFEQEIQYSTAVGEVYILSYFLGLKTYAKID
ncbi:hypothetical protein [Proteiniborus sp.]|uniref:hypothetical protein n=1 Tax=Proteiniborus sp. TaxID=2079015 RepID=UPI00331B95DB